MAAEVVDLVFEGVEGFEGTGVGALDVEAVDGVDLFVLVIVSG